MILIVRIFCPSLQVASGCSPKQVEDIHCGVLVNAAGPSAGYLAKKLGIDLPVEPRKRCVFVLDCPDAPAKDAMPFVIDKSGVYVRNEGGRFISGGPIENVSLHDVHLVVRCIQRWRRRCSAVPRGFTYS